MKLIEEVEVISYFHGDGEVEPIRLRISTDNEDVVLSISRIFERRLSKLNGNPMIIFKCESITENEKLFFELHYEMSTCIWRMYK